ncbi:hypothetical protein [Streptomyces sp. S1A1-3]|uniref:hypothetical protein n=1 Tax=Streptomyces sp. S1A1-3 TaxID=2594458 RepID=UPI00163D55A2|nr:hypothetical protein [Streptomyces sp. S1A1-3]
MGGGLDTAQASDVHPGHGRWLVPARAPASFAESVRHQVGEGVGEQVATDVLLMVAHDDLSACPCGPGVRSTATRSPPPLWPKTIQPGEPTSPCTAASDGVPTA